MKTWVHVYLYRFCRLHGSKIWRYYIFVFLASHLQTWMWEAPKFEHWDQRRWVWVVCLWVWPLCVGLTSHTPSTQVKYLWSPNYHVIDWDRHFHTYWEQIKCLPIYIFHHELFLFMTFEFYYCTRELLNQLHHTSCSQWGVLFKFYQFSLDV